MEDDIAGSGGWGTSVLSKKKKKEKEKNSSLLEKI